MKVDYWFPTIVGWADCEFHNEIEDDLIKHCESLQKKIKSGGQNWISKHTYNTSNVYDIFKDEKFKRLNDWVCKEVINFKNECRYKGDLLKAGAWFNIYKKHDYQEWHTHMDHSLSAIYFLKSDKEKSANVFFKSPIAIDYMKPDTDNDFLPTVETCQYFPIKGRLLIFRSNIEHCVAQQRDKNTRITLAYNFNREKI